MSEISFSRRLKKIASSLCNEKTFSSRPRSDFFEESEGVGSDLYTFCYTHILCIKGVFGATRATHHRTLLPVLLPIARRTVRFRRPVLHVQVGNRREKTFGQQARLLLARRRCRLPTHLRCSVRPEPDLQQGEHRCRRAASQLSHPGGPAGVSVRLLLADARRVCDGCVNNSSPRDRTRELDSRKDSN